MYKHHLNACCFGLGLLVAVACSGDPLSAEPEVVAEQLAFAMHASNGRVAWVTDEGTQLLVEGQPESTLLSSTVGATVRLDSTFAYLGTASALRAVPIDSGAPHTLMTSGLNWSIAAFGMNKDSLVVMSTGSAHRITGSDATKVEIVFEELTKPHLASSSDPQNPTWLGGTEVHSAGLVREVHATPRALYVGFADRVERVDRVTLGNGPVPFVTDPLQAPRPHERMVAMAAVEDTAYWALANVEDEEDHTVRLWRWQDDAPQPEMISEFKTCSSWATAIAVNTRALYMAAFWTDWSSGGQGSCSGYSTVVEAPLDGSAPQPLVRRPDLDPSLDTIAATDSHVYFVDNAKGNIRRIPVGGPR